MDRQAAKAGTNDIVAAFDRHSLNLLCLSEIGELGIGLNVLAWLKELLSDSAVSPVVVYSDSHLATIVEVGQQVTKYTAEHTFVDGFISQQEERCFQHFRVCSQGDNKSLSIINCHAPS